MAGGNSTAWLQGLGQKLAIAGVLKSPTSLGWNFVSGVTATYNTTTGYWDLTVAGGGGSAHVIQDEGTPLTQRAALNFVGPNVTVADVGSVTTVTVPLINLGTGVTGSLPIANVGAGFVKVDGSTAFTGDQSFGSHKATNVADAVSASDATNLAQVNALIAAAISVVADWKQSVRAATTAALPANTRVSNVLTANANGALAAQDSVTLIVGDRLLVKDEVTGANRGIYTVTAVGSGGAPWSLTRATDSDTSAEVTTGLTVVVEEGTANGGKPFILTTANPITINTTALAFSVLASATAGNGLTGTGSLAVLANGATIDVSASGVKVATSGITPTELAANAVTTAKILDANVTTAKILDANITTAKIADANVTLAKHAAGTAKGNSPVFGNSSWGEFGVKTRASDLTDANATLAVSDGNRALLPAATLTANRQGTFSLAGAVDKEIYTVERYDTTAFTYAIKNSLGVTLYTFPVSVRRMASFQYTGGEWALVSHVAIN